ncbi:MAG: Porin O [Steroidobacteraceae bacterium]|nr:Porin O [Steroidobacteraceae bacterium]
MSTGREIVKRLLVGFSLMACVGAMHASHAFEVEPMGRLHLDYAAHDADRRPMDDGFYLRRARLGLRGKFDDHWSFEVEYDFVGHGAYKNVSLQYEGWKPGAINLGQFKVPFGLAAMTSSNNLLFIERALPAETFAPSRRLGVGIERNRDRYTVAVMGFGRSIDDRDDAHGAGARFTWTPFASDDTVVHLGLGAMTERPRGDVKVSARPESRVADVKLVNTGDLDGVDRVDRWGLEAAFRSGPLLVQAEWIEAEILRDAGTGDASVGGWYVAGSWIVTGESRKYKHGTFKGVTPNRRGGALELTARYSHLDLDDGDVRGGTERNATLGLNYYLTGHLRFMVNYIDVRSRRRGTSDDPDILLLRAQAMF